MSTRQLLHSPPPALEQERVLWSANLAEVLRFFRVLGFVRATVTGDATAPPSLVRGGLRLLLSGMRNASGVSPQPISLVVSDPSEAAVRCWDAGLTIEVAEREDGSERLTVVGPGGIRVALQGADGSR